MNILFSMNVFFADWFWGINGQDVAFGILSVLVVFFFYDGIKNRKEKWWRDRNEHK